MEDAWKLIRADAEELRREFEKACIQVRGTSQTAQTGDVEISTAPTMTRCQSTSSPRGNLAVGNLLSLAL
jgi:hypothetical protein